MSLVLCKLSCQTIKLLWEINDMIRTFINLKFQFNHARFEELNLMYVDIFYAVYVNPSCV